MKTFSGIGQYYLDPVPYSNCRWYYAIDSNHGDIYEAYEILEQGHILKGDVLTLVSYPEGKVCYQSERRQNLSYVSPVFDQGMIFYAAVDFDENKLSIIKFDPETAETEEVEVMSLSVLETCYNLRLDLHPLTLSVQYTLNEETVVHIVYPENVIIKGELRESFYHREGNELYISRWHEDENYNYYEDTVIRDISSGEIIRELEGDITIMPDGQKWLIK